MYVYNRSRVRLGCWPSRAIAVKSVRESPSCLEITEVPHKEGPRVLNDEANRVLCLENTAAQPRRLRVGSSGTCRHRDPVPMPVCPTGPMACRIS